MEHLIISLNIESFGKYLNKINFKKRKKVKNKNKVKRNDLFKLI
jgi:hypothetical protein